ncbi:hypothetical protein NPIL_54921 [Nephila pilipes]|uniref:Uncharacterized protein n=1 Tax=Nephila pilipes TaxID=299642 RepID=A0A8X6QGW8_NEPPI|nr:hypothetical protein NPIL_54921 [Nephila pilipes]
MVVGILVLTIAIFHSRMKANTTINIHQKYSNHPYHWIQEERGKYRLLFYKSADERLLPYRKKPLNRCHYQIFKCQPW